MFHKTKLEENIGCLGVVKPTLNIVDGICAMEENGPHHGKDKELNFLFVGDDMVELDSLVCSMIGVNYRSVEHIRIAEEGGLGKFISQEIVDQCEKYITKIEPASPFIKVGKNIYVWPTTSCSRCITALTEGAKLYRRNIFRNIKFGKKAYLGDKKLNFVIGKGIGLNIERGEKIIAIGNCAKEFAENNSVDCLDKCPPSAKEVCDYLKDKI